MVRIGIKFRFYPLYGQLYLILIVEDYLLAVALPVVPRPAVFTKIVSIAASVPDTLYSFLI